MANPYPANFETLGGSRRLTGQVNFTDAGNQPGSLPDPITDPVTIHPANATLDALTIESDGAGGVQALQITAPHTTVSVDGDGIFNYDGDDGVDLNVRNTFGAGSHSAIAAKRTVGNNATRITDAPSLILSDDTVPNITLFQVSLSAFKFALTDAPADGSLSAGEVALWFDSTNGASKLMIKGKSANGTVVTGSVALA